jgi:hypothetical protein
MILTAEIDPGNIIGEEAQIDYVNKILSKFASIIDQP